MKTIFWNVDTQYDFMHKDGALYVNGAEGIEENLTRLTNFAADNKIKVVSTADWHNAQTEEISDKPDFKTTFPRHCMQNTLGARFVPATEPENPYIIDWAQEGFDRNKVLQRRNVILYKDKFDIFRGNLHADEIVKIISPEKAIVYGVATNVCVNDAVNGLLERKVQVYVPIDAIKELPGLPLPYNNWQNNGAILTKMDEIYKILEGKR